jgi:PIN domain nuclease of toxin-antitoxin system
LIVRDTHVLFWWLSEAKSELTPAALAAIEAEELGGEIISMSAWEMALLVTKRRVALTVPLGEWLSAAASIDSGRFVPVDNTIAVASIDLPGASHRDPADRIIVATARSFGAPLVTKDAKLRTYPHPLTIW